MRKFFILITVALLAGISASYAADHQAEGAAELDDLKSRLELETRTDYLSSGKVSRGYFTVYENRTAPGRKIKLAVFILHSRSRRPEPDPMFMLAGGPGQDATQMARIYENSWIREKRDIVLVSQRGTGGDNRMLCPQAASDDNPQDYLEPFFSLNGLQECLRELADDFDLTQYSTFHAAHDLDEIRLALGYAKINLMGGSYGSRMALIYMRLYPGSVRTAVLNGVAPVAALNPLYHAQSAQAALELLFEKCSQDPDCSSRYPNMEEEFWTVIERLDQNPEEIYVPHPTSGKRIKVTMTRDVFAEAIRMQMYSRYGAARVPGLIHRAFLKEYYPFISTAMSSNRGVVRMLSIGLLMCVTCSEDIDRIEQQDISRLTKGTFLGDIRVLDQIAACKIWPRTELPEDHGAAVRAPVPTLLLSGILDPVTPPRWGAEAARNLPHSLHLVVPGSHGVGGPCIDSIIKQFLETGSESGLDITCIKKLAGISFDIVR